MAKKKPSKLRAVVLKGKDNLTLEDEVLIKTSDRRFRGRAIHDAAFPVSPPLDEIPRGYAKFLSELKKRIETERVRIVISANSGMVILYWDIGKTILDRRKKEGWGTKVIDRIAADLKKAFPGI